MNKDRMAVFVVDVESIGLHGEAFAVAGGLYIDGAAQWEFKYSCDPGLCSGSASDRKWVEENIPQFEITHRGPKSMRESFWNRWQEAKAQKSTMAADCLWPVEARFVAQCVDDDAEYRRWEGPYPFMEISTYLEATGVDPMADHERRASELPKHDPLADVRQSARLLFEAIESIGGSA